MSTSSDKNDRSKSIVAVQFIELTPTEQAEATARKAASHRALFAYCAPQIKQGTTVQELDKKLTLLKWAQACADLPNNCPIPFMDEFSKQEQDQALADAKRRKIRAQEAPTDKIERARLRDPNIEILVSAVILFIIGAVLWWCNG
jgi:hypothetical protein